MGSSFPGPQGNNNQLTPSMLDKIQSSVMTWFGLKLKKEKKD